VTSVCCGPSISIHGGAYVRAISNSLGRAVFRYNPAVHNVVAVDAGGYYGCRSSGTSYNSGNDRITLRPGTNYFICSLNGHCSMGMKMAVTAS
jgi:plastocyanin